MILNCHVIIEVQAYIHIFEIFGIIFYECMFYKYLVPVCDFYLFSYSNSIFYIWWLNGVFGVAYKNVCLIQAT